MKFSRPLWIALFIMTGLIGGCSTTDTPGARTADTAKPKTGMTQQASLYQRLGEKPAITAVVDEFVARVAADSRINSRFANYQHP